MTNLILIITMIYLFLVFRIYSLTLYYAEFDEVRKYTWFAPLIAIVVFIYALLEKESIVLRCFIFHLPTAYAIIGIEYCLLRKEHQPKKKVSYSKQHKRDQNMKILLRKTEKILCEC